MKIHQIELEHVRNLKRVTLDVSSPVTVIAGRNGVGKTTVQKALLATMFKSAKKDRDSLISRFDPHSTPRAMLRFSRTEPVATIALSRTLTDDQGEWSEGGTTLKQKGIALEKIQESLPISAETASSLLWGVQEEMAELLGKFPDEGHSLLTAATIRGKGPDPKEVLAKIEKQIKDARRKGQKPGPLVAAQKAVDESQNAVEEAIRDTQRFQELERHFGQAQAERERLQVARTQLEQDVKDLAERELLLESCLRANERLERLQQQAGQWERINGRIDESRHEQQTLLEQKQVLDAQLSVARYHERARQIANKRERLEQIRAAQVQLEQICGELTARARPDRAAREKCRVLRNQIQQSQVRLEASGLRYHVVANTQPGQVEIQEDQTAPRLVALDPGAAHNGIVGKIVFKVGDVSIQATGKEDVAEHARIISEGQAELQKLFTQFEASNNSEFDALAEEYDHLVDSERNIRAEYERRVGDRSLESLEAELAALEQQQEGDVAKDVIRQQLGEPSAGQSTPPIAELERRTIQLDTELKSAQRLQSRTEGERPTAEQQEQLARDLAAAQRDLDSAQRQFGQSAGLDESSMPSLDLRNVTQKKLKAKQHELGSLLEDLRSAEKRQTQYSMDLKYAAPRKSVAVLKEEALAAEAVLSREEMLQSARALLRDRIQSTIQELSEAVPRDLSERISRHLSQLTSGSYNKVMLDDQLTISEVQQSGDFPETWGPGELSTGERTMAALTIKVAVARALAEINGPIFIVLDDSLVNLDPEHRTASERLLLDLVADGQLQILFFTCHTDWAQAWRNQAPEVIRYVKLDQVTEYYRTPAACCGTEPRSTSTANTTRRPQAVASVSNDVPKVSEREDSDSDSAGEKPPRGLF